MSTEVSLFYSLSTLTRCIFTRFRFVIFGVLFNSTKLISNETLCLQCLAKINPQYRYPITEFFRGEKLPCQLLQQVAFMRINKLSLNK